MRPPIVLHVVKNLVAETAAALDSGVSPQATFPAAKLKPGGVLEDERGLWPLTVFAARHGAAATLRLLLERGGTIPPEHLARSLATFAPLKDQAAAASTVSAILKTVDVQQNGPACIGAILSAASTFSIPVIEAVLTAGVSLKTRDEYGRSVLNSMLRTSSMTGLRYGSTRLPVVELLLARGAPVDMVDERGNLPLHYAIAMGSQELALLFLRAGSPGVGRLTPDKTDRLADVVARTREIKSEKGDRADDLFALAHHQAWDLMLELGELGMNLNVYNFNTAGKNPWKVLREKGSLEQRVRALPLIDREAMLRTVVAEAGDEKGLAMLKAALALGGELNFPDLGGEHADATVLGAALAANAPVEVLELLLSHGAAIQSPEGRWPHAVSAAVHVSKLEWLANKGVALDEYVEPWGTPLHRAVELKAEASVHFLVKRGARIDWANPRGETPASLAKNKNLSAEALAVLTPPPAPPVVVSSLDVQRTERSELSRAVAKEDLDAVCKVLDAGADVNAPDARGSTALAIAAAQGWLDGVTLLLECGAKPDTPTRSGFISFTTAHVDVQRALEKAGAQTATRAVSRARLVPFRHKALLERGDVRSVAAAIAAGMDVDFPVAGSALPLMIAIDRDDAAMIELLLRAGADPNAKQDTDTCVEHAFHSEKPHLVKLLVAAGGTPPGAPTASEGSGVPAFDDAAGKVALFINAGLVDSDDPDAFGDEEPPFWVDHDRFENVDVRDGNLDAIRALSYSASFADAAIAAIQKLDVKVTHVFALYGSSARLSPGRLPAFWSQSPGLYVMESPAYAGAFSYEKNARR
ncbi:MAG: ankyrin repeat domain-containing protein [Archangium sp.]